MFVIIDFMLFDCLLLVSRQHPDRESAPCQMKRAAYRVIPLLVPCPSKKGIFDGINDDATRGVGSERTRRKDFKKREGLSRGRCSTQ